MGYLNNLDRDVLGDEEEEVMPVMHSSVPEDSPDPQADLHTMPIAPAPLVADEAAPDAPFKIQNPLVQDYMDKYSQAARDKIVAQNKEDASGPNWMAGLAAFGSGLQGGNSIEAGQNFIKNQQAQRDKKLTDFDTGKQTMLASQELDPNSAASMRFKDTLKTNFPEIAKKYGDSFDKLTAADQKNVFQVVETKAKLDDAKSNREQVNILRAQGQSDRRDKLAAENDNKDAMKLQDTLSKGWTGRSGQAGQVQGKINAAERAQQLLDQISTQKDGADSRQIEELAQSTAALLGGGTQASSRVDALVPHTFWGKAQGLKEYLTNSPQGLGQQDFQKRLADTIAREKQVAEDQKRQYQIESLAGHDRLRKNNPDLYERQLRAAGIEPNMIDDNGRYKKPAGMNMAGDSVKMQGPDGQIRLIPKEKVKAALASGGKLIDDPNSTVGAK